MGLLLKNKMSVLCLFLCLAVYCVTPVESVKQCLQPIRKRVWDPHCYEAEVPKTILKRTPESTIPLGQSKKSSGDDNDGDNDSCPNDSSPQSPMTDDNVYDGERDASNSFPSTDSSRADVCSFVADAIFADFPVFDMVFLNQGTCNHADISEGVFDSNDAATILPYQNELVAIRLLGKHIQVALEHGIFYSSKSPNYHGAYPVTAGIQYDTQIDFERLSNQGKNHMNDEHRPVQVSNMRIMDFDCQYQAIEHEKAYTVLTNQYLVNGGDGYGVFPLMKQSRVIPTGVSETDSLWFHAQSTCKVETSWETQQERDAEKAKKGMKMIYVVGERRPLFNVTTMPASI